MIGPSGPLRAHVSSLWPGASWPLPLVPLLWPLSRLLSGELRGEYLLILVGVPLLAFSTAATKRLFWGLYPFFLLGVIYDSMRFVKNLGLTEQRVHVCDLRAVEMTLFSVDTHGVRGTVHDWVQAHPSLLLDVLAAVPYGTFIVATLAFSVFLYTKDHDAMHRFGWAFLVVNLAGFVTYHVYPAAPPWYYHAHGCSVDLLAKASTGPNLARVDAWLGWHYFSGFYGRSNDTFGAVPSLHVSYPMLVVLYGWRRLGPLGRAGAILFLASMCFAAVYLDHHWIVDVVLGLVYTVVSFAVVHYVGERIRGRRPAPQGATGPLAASESSGASIP